MVFVLQPRFLNDVTADSDCFGSKVNKIIRFSYGSEIEYQRLASQAAEIWDAWNQEIAGLAEEELPEVLRKGERKLWNKCGFLRMGARNEFADFELQTLQNMEKEGIRDTQFKSDDVDGECLVFEKGNEQKWSQLNLHVALQISRGRHALAGLIK